MADAIKPNYFNIPSLQADVEAQKRGITDEERQLHAMSESGGWKRLTEIKANVLNDLDQINEAAIARGATREEIGDNTIVISLVKGVIKQLWNKVEDAREAIEQSGAA